MKPVARIGDSHQCGNPDHGANTIVSGGTGKADGIPVARIGDTCECGAAIIQGSSQWSDDGKPVAYIGCATQCGPYTGQITSGSPSTRVRP